MREEIGVVYGYVYIPADIYNIIGNEWSLARPELLRDVKDPDIIDKYYLFAKNVDEKKTIRVPFEYFDSPSEWLAKKYYLSEVRLDAFIEAWKESEEA